MKLPRQDKWVQTNTSDKAGDILGSFNLDLNTEGKVKIGGRLILNTSSSNDDNFGFPWGIIFNPSMGTGGQWQIGVGSKMFTGTDLPNEGFTISTATTPPLFGNNQRPDLKPFPRSNGDVYTAGTGGATIKILALDGSAWTNVDISGASDSTAGAPLIYFPGTGRLYYKLTKSSMGSIDSPVSSTPVAPTNQYALNLNDKSQSIQCGSNTTKYIYLGTFAISPKDKARIHEWNGSSVSVNDTAEINAQAVLAMAIFQNTNWCIDSNGWLRANNGGQYVKVQRLPFKKGKFLKPLSLDNQSSGLLVHYNGMTADADRILITVNPVYLDGTSEEICPSGTWEYTPENGLHHLGSPAMDSNSFGAHKVVSAGAISLSRINDTDSNGDFLTGFSFYSDATTTKYGIFYNDTRNTVAKMGYLITPKIYPEQIIDTFQKIFLKYRKFLNADNEIVAKYRTEEIIPVEITGTWNSATAFTTTTDITAYENYEIDVLNGIGSGRSVHLSNITDVGGGNFTANVDENSGGTGTFKARISNWKKIGTATGQLLDVKEIPVMKRSSWIQFKILMRHFGDDELNEILITNNNSQPAK